jgi:hypothetical protein
MVAEGYTIDVLAKLTAQFSANRSACHKWLAAAGAGNKMAYMPTCLAAALFVVCSEKCVVEKSLAALLEACKDTNVVSIFIHIFNQSVSQ